MIPKYARLEHERRFLVDPQAAWRDHLKPYSKLLQDRYLDCGRLRLRRIEDSDSGAVSFKLTKKFESGASFSCPIVSVQLLAAEYKALTGLPGRDLSKRRHYHEVGERTFSIDVFEGGLSGLITCETEAETLDALLEVRFPAYARWEITENPMFTGGLLCRTEWREVEAAIACVKAG